ncbi:MAG: hypothetical protein ABEJ96_01145, partial [Thiohalorhabdaceae bacterium]
MANWPPGRLLGLPGSIGRNATSLLLDLILYRQNGIHCTGRSNYRPGHPTLIVTNHRRDTDGPLVATML